MSFEIVLMLRKPALQNRAAIREVGEEQAKTTPLMRLHVRLDLPELYYQPGLISPGSLNSLL
jgi:hypothetical protein